MHKILNPELGIGVAIIENDQILLTKRRDYPVWCLPGGHLAPGESVLEAAIREVYEETGLIVQLTSFVGFYSLPYKWEKGSCEIILSGKIKSGELLTSTNETCDATFFPLDELPGDLVGWQFHQAQDALLGKSGVLSIYDTKLSIRQLRDRTINQDEGEISEDKDWLFRLCEHPNRFDLANSN